MEAKGNWIFLDGETSDRATVAKRCMTKMGASGKSREDLDLAVDATISFFKKNMINRSQD